MIRVLNDHGAARLSFMRRDDADEGFAGFNLTLQAPTVRFELALPPGR